LMPTIEKIAAPDKHKYWLDLIVRCISIMDRNLKLLTKHG